MKKLLTMVCCFVLVAGILSGCGNEKDKNPTDTTTKPSTSATEPSIPTTAPTSDPTVPSTIPDSGSMPNNDTNNGNGSADGMNGNGMDGSMDNGTTRSRPHAPSVVGGSR